LEVAEKSSTAVTAKSSSSSLLLPVPPADKSQNVSSSHAAFAHSVTAALKRKDEEFMRDVFHRYADAEGELSALALFSALEVVDAPVLTSRMSSPEDIFYRADTSMSGSVDFAECVPSLQFFDFHSMACLLI
jgi:hypothetical protein